MIGYDVGDLIVCVESGDCPLPPWLQGTPPKLGRTYVCRELAPCVCGCERIVVFTEDCALFYPLRYGHLDLGYPANWFRKAEENKHVEHLKQGLHVPNLETV